MKKIVSVNDVSKRIKKVLEEEGKSKSDKELAQQLDLPVSTLNNYKTGRLPQLEQLIKIRNNLSLPFGYLLGEIDVTKYEDDEKNTFGLTEECIIRLEKLNEEELKCLSNFIVNLPKDFMAKLSDYSKMPKISENEIKISQNTNLIEHEMFHLLMEDEYIKNNLMKDIEYAFETMKPDSKDDFVLVTKEGKEIGINLTTRIIKNNRNTKK